MMVLSTGSTAIRMDHITGLRQNGLIKEKKSITTVEIVQDCFILIKAKRLSANIRKGLFNVIDEYGLFDELDICDCTSVKRKLYYILLKEKRWTAMRAIVNLKQALKR